MKRIVFTKENRIKTRTHDKTQTRRIGENPWKAEVGEVRAIAEPTQATTITDRFAIVRYPDDGILMTSLKCPLSQASYNKLVCRKDPHAVAIARFMLDDFARHFAKITAIKVEPLQEITPQECYAEGIRVYEGDRLVLPGETKVDDAIYLDGFIRLWNSINYEKDRRAWDNNPTVTAYTYEFLGSDRNG